MRARRRARVRKIARGVGVHLLADLYGVPADRLCDGELLGEVLLSAAGRAGLRAVAPPQLQRFPNGGVTGVLLLAESHIAFHSYPELGYLALDAFTCGPAEPAPTVATFVAALCPTRTITRSARRGDRLR